MTLKTTPIADAKPQEVEYEDHNRELHNGYYLGAFTYNTTSSDGTYRLYQESFNYALLIDKKTGKLVRINIDRESHRLRFILN